MDPKKLVPLALVAIVSVGALAGDDHGTHLPHPRPFVIMVDGTGKPGLIAEASNTQAGSYSGDGIIRVASRN